MKEIDKVIEKHGGWPGAFAAAADTSKTVRSGQAGKNE
jgi:hypothetical protein